MGGFGALDVVIHPLLHELLVKFYPTAVEVQSSTVVLGQDGEQQMTWATFLEATGNLAMESSTEARGATFTQVGIGLALNLDGHYPTITQEHRVIVGGAAYGIEGVIHDSLSASTRLTLREVTY